MSWFLIWNNVTQCIYKKGALVRHNNNTHTIKTTTKSTNRQQHENTHKYMGITTTRTLLMYHCIFSFNPLLSSSYTNNVIIKYNHLRLSQPFTTLSTTSYKIKKKHIMHSNTLDHIYQSALSPTNFPQDTENLRYYTTMKLIPRSTSLLHIN